MKSFEIVTLGCKVNQYESDALGEILSTQGFSPVQEGTSADVIIINTCTVTNTSDQKSRQIVRKTKRANPKAIVVVAGCYAQVSPEEVEEIEGVDIIMGTQNRHMLPAYIERFEIDRERIIAISSHEQESGFEELPLYQGGQHTRAYMKVQDGCNSYCSYCIIPYARGFIRSRDREDALREAERLASLGYREIILTGIQIGAYGMEKKDGYGLIDLIEDIAGVEGIDRIRLSSVEPRTITQDFLERAIATGKFMDHFHLSLQSGCDKVLREMNRKYTTTEYRMKVDLIRRYMPYAGITTDIIAGFPGETEEDFDETLAFVRKIGFSRIHPFPYSPREKTPAARRKDQIEKKVKRARVRALTELGQELQEDFHRQNLGRRLSVLFEEKEDSFYYGYTSNYIRIKSESEIALSGKIGYIELREIENEPVLANYVGGEDGLSIL